MKIEWLGKAGIDASHVRFVSVDFTHDNVFNKLKASGYDTRKETIFLWEGVTLYLSEQNVRLMFREIGANAVSGSAVVADFYGNRFIQIGKSKAGSKTLELTQEGLRFGLPFNKNHESVFDDFIRSEKLSAGETFFMGSSDKNGPFMVVSEIRI